MRIDKVLKTQCTGCSACSNACHEGAISMMPDNDLFLYPRTDESLCISCGRCAAVCPALTPAPAVHSSQFFAAKHKEHSVHVSSQSGGVFFTLAAQCIENGGKVFGAAFASDWNVSHICADSLTGLEKLQGSKYVQSDPGDTFSQVKKAVGENIPVIFSGTPCQCAGLRRFLGKSYENLLTVDLICHGVPAPKLWQDYLAYMKKKYHGEIDNAVFRVHDGTRRGHTECITINGINRYTVTYGQLFYTHAFLRQSCLNCQYRTLERTGDISIGDWVGGQRIDPDFWDNCGVSLVLINTAAGKTAWDMVKNKFTLRTLTETEALQPPLKNVFHIPPASDKMRTVWHSRGFAAAARKYGHEPYAKVLKRRLKKIIKL
ncbi:MAG: Coenzyme F420 hydrogenase/dehydrogenase, beta subunit C-terminal domain [Oscillospiraceae bacterium]|nr:Coenzyme F420 hydrogenase/dehydrogenase, beta subunit C-terminal domain [Oscillospiraceae bacterium]